jgi:hypothetical protein
VEKKEITHILSLFIKVPFPQKQKINESLGQKKKSPIIGIGIVLIYYLELEPDIIKVKY